VQDNENCGWGVPGRYSRIGAVAQDILGLFGQLPARPSPLSFVVAVVITGAYRQTSAVYWNVPDEHFASYGNRLRLDWLLLAMLDKGSGFLENSIEQTISRANGTAVTIVFDKGVKK
jgi:hypothetical protein